VDDQFKTHNHNETRMVAVESIGISLLTSSSLHYHISVIKQVMDARRLDSEVVTLQESNVELKNRLIEMKKKFQSKELLIRDGIVKNQLSNLLRAKMRNSIRRRFDK
jgi:DNA-binding protein H-NS